MCSDDLSDVYYSMDAVEDVKRVALYILDGSGNIEDVIIDIDEMIEYLNTIYEKYPTAD